MKNNKEYFDLSDYPKNDSLFDSSNKKVIGKFKNESIKQITEFCALRAKSYSYKVDNDEDEHIKCKGIKKKVAKILRIEQYKNVLFNRTKENVKQNCIRSYGHEIFTEEIDKCALSCNDDKVFICNNNIDTYNFCHYKTKI
jgi:hypothetical protein